ncbi:SusC/RagA family TonB-linked outer membrane protein [Kaistella jeonii]|uniref:TonB-dependent receptor n=1 Tax=Kaistella jeonii TaxID=266749 RepID=A0A0C1CVY0_9FLAO|nr:SusC/RagA family TonB-linked outer membrane protein [Kaistella jeonii]KIA88501.1 TonB-dependent receptor [Kaistella jeonii]SFC19437.1 TonB-linked outer membrane protein, SusC/RagA family [Kaistella jeonii]VEI97032.1 Outer membrane cobalamin receptor protein [Kaistella jeonii]
MKKILSPIGLVSCCLIFSAVHAQVKAQTRIVTGQVNNGEKPIAGATIAQQDTTQMTTTSSSGAFTLQIIGENPVLIIRHPEYNEQKILLDAKTNFTIALTEKVKSIEEVVLNAGYYNVKAKESTGSIAKVLAKDIENQPVNNVLSTIQGRIAGVSITQNSGTPGGGYDVQIRGRNSLRNLLNSMTDGNAPLYIIDGVPAATSLSSTLSAGALPLQSINPLNSINPNDIASIEVLKDADATAIYGSRGGNGVILVTTKKGKASPVRLTVNSNQSFSQVGSKLKMMNSAEYTAMRQQAYANVGTVSYPANAYDLNGAWDQTRYTDWQQELIGSTAVNTNVLASVSGGSEKNTFSVSAGYADQTSVFPGDQHYKTNTFSSHFDHRSADQRFNLGLSNNFTVTGNTTLNLDLTNKALGLSPTAPALYDNTGHLNWEKNTFNNPLAQLNARYMNRTKHLNQNLTSSYRIGHDFTVKLNAGFTLEHLDERSQIPNTIYNPAYGLTTDYSSSSQASSDAFSYLLEPQVTWVKKYGSSEWSLLSGITFQQSITQNSAINGYGFASNALLDNVASATTVTVSPSKENQYRYAAVFGRINYQYKNRYIANLTARRDGSSRFGPSHRFANFGALGAAWILSEEKFLKEVPWLSFAKLRGSYGRTGSDAIGDFQFTDTYSIGYNAYDGMPGLYPSRLYNPDFSWEQTDKTEAALEVSLFKERINLTAAWYRNRSSNQLVGTPLPATTGFTSILANLGATVENRGFEFELNTTPLKSKDWKWTASFNISLPQNKLLAFPGLEGSTYANRYVIGESIYAVKLLDYQGIDATGHYTFKDFNGDGKIVSPDDAQMVRTLGPQYFGGLQNTLSYHNFSLAFLLQFVKQEGWNYFHTMSTPGLMVNQPAELLNVWSPSNTGGIIMPYTPGNDAVTNALTEHLMNSTAAVSDASFLRLKNIQLNYRVPMHNTLVHDATVYLQGQNLWTWTKYFGLDPEFVTSGFLPPLKTLSLGFQLTF